MNFVSYIRRQKSIIRSRHEGETFFMDGADSAPISLSDKIFTELDSAKGLNVKERLANAFHKARA